MLEVMMALGTYRFGLSTAAYDSLRRHAEWRWPVQERLGTYPARQYVGPGDETLRLAGVLYPHYKGLLGLPSLLSRVPALAGAIGTAAGINSALGRFGMGIERAGAWALEQMRADAETGQPLLMVDGRGRIWGYWSLLSLEEGESRHMADGAALRIEFAAELAFYGADAPSGLSADTSVGGAVRGLLGI